MPRSLGKDKSTLKRGQQPSRVRRNSQRAPYGVVGHWQGINQKVYFNEEACYPFVHDDGERLHVMWVPVDLVDIVFHAMKNTYSWSKNLASKLLFEAVLLNPKPLLWHHGMVKPGDVVEGGITLEEHHAPRPPKQAEPPWETPPDPSMED